VTDSAVIETERLILRNWREADVSPFHAMYQDARVMEHLGPPESLETVGDIVSRLQCQISDHECGFWAMERRGDGRFLGFCGVKPGPEDSPITDKPEIGWRLAHEHWGHGYAREAAEASIEWVWRTLPDDAVWAITVPANARSWSLMERLGMKRQHDLDFDHPNVPDGSPLIRHITYRLGRPR